MSKPKFVRPVGSWKYIFKSNAVSLKVKCRNAYPDNPEELVDIIKYAMENQLNVNVGLQDPITGHIRQKGQYLGWFSIQHNNWETPHYEFVFQSTEPTDTLEAWLEDFTNGRNNILGYVYKTTPLDGVMVNTTTLKVCKGSIDEEAMEDLICFIDDMIAHTVPFFLMDGSYSWEESDSGAA